MDYQNYSEKWNDLLYELKYLYYTKAMLLMYYSGAAEAEDRAPQWSSASRTQRHSKVGGQGHGQVSQ